MPDVTEDFLSHYGVKGMHWGKHKAKGGSSVEKTGGGSKEVARAQKSDAKAAYKDKVSANRSNLYKGFSDHMKTPAGKVTAGASIAAGLLGSPIGSQVIGAQMMRSAGFSKGKSFTVAFLGGAPGAALAVELKARKMAKA